MAPSLALLGLLFLSENKVESQDCHEGNENDATKDLDIRREI